MKYGLVLVAAGRGERLGAPCNKALVPLGKKPLLLHAMDRLIHVPGLEETVVVLHPDDLEAIKEGELGGYLYALGARRLIAGGARRQDSVLLGLQALSADVGGVLIHDAARPFPDVAVATRLLAALEEHAGAVPVVPVTSTVKRIDGRGRVLETPDRAALRLAQTPQAARRLLLIRALEHANAADIDVTDDVQALERLGEGVIAVEDSRWNFKVTTPEDLALAECVLEQGLAAGESP